MHSEIYISLEDYLPKENFPVEQRCCLSSHLCLLSIGTLLGNTSRNTRQMKRNCMSDWCLIACVHNSIGSPEILNKNLFRYRAFLIFGFPSVSWMWLLFGYSSGSDSVVVNLNLQLLALGLEVRTAAGVYSMFLKQGKKWIITLVFALQMLWSISFFIVGR